MPSSRKSSSLHLPLPGWGRHLLWVPQFPVPPQPSPDHAGQSVVTDLFTPLGCELSCLSLHCNLIILPGLATQLTSINTGWEKLRPRCPGTTSTWNSWAPLHPCSLDPPGNHSLLWKLEHVDENMELNAGRIYFRLRDNSS